MRGDEGNRREWRGGAYWMPLISHGAHFANWPIHERQLLHQKQANQQVWTILLQRARCTAEHSMDWIYLPLVPSASVPSFSSSTSICWANAALRSRSWMRSSSSCFFSLMRCARAGEWGCCEENIPGVGTPAPEEDVWRWGLFEVLE